MIDISIDHEVYARLQADAIPLEDTANSVLRRLLGIDPSQRNRPAPRANSGDMLPLRAFRPYILARLVQRGTASRGDILEYVYPKIAGQLTDLDRAEYPSGGLRWENRVTNEVSAMAREGLVERVRRGMWRITERGLSQFAETGLPATRVEDSPNNGGSHSARQRESQNAVPGLSGDEASHYDIPEDFDGDRNQWDPSPTSGSESFLKAIKSPVDAPDATAETRPKQILSGRPRAPRARVLSGRPRAPRARVLSGPRPAPKAKVPSRGHRDQVVNPPSSPDTTERLEDKPQPSSGAPERPSDKEDLVW